MASLAANCVFVITVGARRKDPEWGRAHEKEHDQSRASYWESQAAHCLSWRCGAIIAGRMPKLEQHHNMKMICSPSSISRYHSGTILHALR
jgi:hypothetical protein